MLCTQRGDASDPYKVAKMLNMQKDRKIMPQQTRNKHLRPSYSTNDFNKGKFKNFVENFNQSKKLKKSEK